MSKQTEDKKLNQLDLKKETVSDLDVPQGQEVVGGAGSQSPAACIPKPSYLVGDRGCPGSDQPKNCLGPPPSKPTIYERNC